MGALIDAISQEWRRKSEDRREPLLDAKVTSFFIRKCNEVFGRDKTENGRVIPVIAATFEIGEKYMSSVIKTVDRPEFKALYVAEQSPFRQKNGAYTLTVRRREL